MSKSVINNKKSSLFFKINSSQLTTLNNIFLSHKKEEYINKSNIINEKIKSIMRNVKKI